MFYRLKDKYLLRGWINFPYAIVNRNTKKIFFLKKKDLDLLNLCNGKINFDIDILTDDMRIRVKRFVEEGFVEKTNKVNSISPEQEYFLYPLRYIRTVHWSITGRCNYRCRHCYMSAPDAKFGELSLDTIKEIINQLASCGIMRVSITGGEALVRKDFMDIVDALLDKDIQITTIYSNGSLIKKELLDELKKRRIFPQFNFSYDGEGWHDWLRGVDGAEESVKKAFLLCRENGFSTAAEMCIHNKNKYTLRKSVCNLHNWGCMSLKTSFISNVGAWFDNGYGESINRNELYQLYLDYIPQYYEDGMPLAIQLGGFFSANPLKPMRYTIPLRKHCDNPDTMCLCGHARMNLYISAEGRVLPCMALSGMDIQKKFPLLTEAGLNECLTNSFYVKMIDERLSTYIKHNPQCANCKYLAQCCGGCRAGGLEVSSNDMLAPDLNACTLFNDGWIEKIDQVVNQSINKFSNCENIK